MSDDKKLTVQEYIRSEIETLHVFEKWYTQKVAAAKASGDSEETSLWPERMGAGDFDEAVHFFDPVNVENDKEG